MKLFRLLCGVWREKFKLYPPLEHWLSIEGACAVWTVASNSHDCSIVKSILVIIWIVHFQVKWYIPRRHHQSLTASNVKRCFKGKPLFLTSSYTNPTSHIDQRTLYRLIHAVSLLKMIAKNGPRNASHFIIAMLWVCPRVYVWTSNHFVAAYVERFDHLLSDSCTLLGFATFGAWNLIVLSSTKFWQSILCCIIKVKGQLMQYHLHEGVSLLLCRFTCTDSWLAWPGFHTYKFLKGSVAELWVGISRFPFLDIEPSWQIEDLVWRLWCIYFQVHIQDGPPLK